MFEACYTILKIFVHLGLKVKSGGRSLILIVNFKKQLCSQLLCLPVCMKRSDDPKCSIQSFLIDGIHHKQENT